MKKVSIIIPVYNEKNTIKKLVERVENASFCGLDKEIILVDDASNDGSTEILKETEEIKGIEGGYKVLYHQKNQGKGAAIRTAVKEASGDYIVIQDADFEYNPDDYDKMLPLLINNEADVVYGSRFLDSENLKHFMLKNKIANKFLTLLTNILFCSKVTDMETCYKAFKRENIQNINIKSSRFDFEPEITAKILKQKLRFKEVSISYKGRSHNEGKKINWKDGLNAVFALIKYRFAD